MSNELLQTQNEENLSREQRVVSVIDKDGSYVRPIIAWVDITGDGAELCSPVTESLALGEKLINSLPQIRQNINSSGLIKPVWYEDSYWIEGATDSDIKDWEALNSGDSLTPEQKDIAALKKENLLLKAQLQAQTERTDFLEDCIAEMASLVYM